MRRLSIRRSCGGVFWRAGEFLPVTPFRQCEFLFSRHCEEQSDEAIAPLHIPFSIKCFEAIALLTAFARNDVVGLQIRNGGVTKTMLIALQRS